MSHMKRLLAVLLAVLMCVSCLAGLSFADSKTVARTASAKEVAGEGKADDRQTEAEFKGDLQRIKTAYANDDTVMVIVLLEGKAPAEVTEGQRAIAATRVAAQHATLRNNLSKAGIRYTVNYEYDAVLNGMAISIAYGDLSKVAALDGVKGAFIPREYSAPVVEPADRMASSNLMTGAAAMQAIGYKGQGKVIAVLDTGITPQHEAFQVYGNTLGEVALTEEAAKAYIESTGRGTYLSDKIPYSYDYADNDNDATDETSGHGTHVSGIAAGYAEDTDGAITFTGTAPYAQIVAMKIFHTGKSGTNSGIYFKALDDCYKLGVDVINMSIGAQNGNVYDTELEDETFGNVYQTLEENGIICCVAAGNEDSMAQYATNWAGSGYVTADYADYGVVGSPSTYDGNLSVASLENYEYPSYVIRCGERDIMYTDSSDDGSFLAFLGGKGDVEYVVIDGYGDVGDFAGVDVKGKIALISRGEITFQEKSDNAAKAGAIAMICYNNQPGTIGMAIDNHKIPSASITMDDGLYLIEKAEMPAEEGGEEPTSTLTVKGAANVHKAYRGGKISSVARKATDDRKVIATRDFQFTAVTNEAQLVDGWYLIGRMSDGKYFNGGAGENINKTGNYVTDDGTEADFTAAALYYSSEDSSLMTSNETYIYGTDGSNGMFVGSDPVAMSISFDEGYAIITNNNTQFAFNASWDGFRFYKTSSTMLANESSKVIMYKLDTFVDPQPISTDKGVLVGWYFESEDEIEDWNFVDADDDGYAWYIDDENEAAYEGTGTIYSLSWDDDALTPDDWAITPAIDLDGIEDAELSLWYNSDPDYPEEVFAVYGGTSADPEAMTELTDDITATGTWTNLRVDLADYAGETIYLAIRHHNCTDLDYLDIDNVEILTASVEPIAPPEPPADVLTGWYFESEDELTGWTFVDKDEDGYNWNHDMTAYYSVPYEGDGSIYSESYHNNESGTGGIALEPDNWAISPAINLDGIEESYLSLWYVGVDEDYAEEVFALYAGTSADPDAMTKLTDDITASGNYQQAVADLSDFAGETIYVAIRHYNVSDMFVLSIDNVEICKGETPVITAPLENAVAAATALDPEGYTEESYADVLAALQTANAVLQNPDSTQAEVDAALADLNAALAALVRVLPTDDLGGEAVYGWYFESDDELDGWLVYDADGDDNNWFRYETEDRAYEGVGVLTSASWYNGEVLTPDNWAITPAIDLTGIEDAVLSLFYAGQDVNFPDENFAVYVGEEADPDKMVDVSGEYTSTDEYQQLVVDLSAYANKTIYVAIRHYDTTDVYRLNIDMVEVRTGTTYEPPVPVIRPIGKVSFPTEMVIMENENGWLMSDFSSWGVTPELTLKPQITGVGGHVYSASFNTTDGYEVMSGTSMATPNMTGMMALVSEYLDGSFSAGKEVSNPFTDVAEGKYYFDAVLWAVGENVTSGTSATTFSPDKACTRGQVVTFLWRAAGSPEPTTSTCNFTDVKAGAYYYKAMLWAVASGVTTGTSATTFSPDRVCTRGQVVTFLWRAAGKPEPTSTECAFTDVNPTGYYYKAMLWAVENGITSGVNATTFKPDGDCTRGQVVTFLYRSRGEQPAGAGVEPLTKVERAEIAEKLTESSAFILVNEDGLAYSPRKQGAGMADMANVIAAPAYFDEPIQNLFDNADGEFEMTLKVKDLYGKGGTFAVNTIVQTDMVAPADWDGDGNVDDMYNTLSPLNLATEPYSYGEDTYPADVEVTAPETVTVPAGGEVEFKVIIKLTEETKAYLDEALPNGAFIEGFVTLLDEEETEIHATYVGFYGDWNKGPILESYDWRDAVDAYNFINYTTVDDAGNTYADYGYTWADAAEFQTNTDPSYVYALNNYALGYYADQTGMYADVGFANSSYLYGFLTGNGVGGFAGDNFFDVVDYSDDRIAITNDSSAMYPIDTLLMIPYNIRNVRHLLMVITDAETGEVYSIDDTEYLPKVAYDAENGFWQNMGIFMYDGTDLNGEPLPDNTKVNINYYGNTMYGEDEIGKIIGEERDYSKMLAEGEDFIVWSYSCVIDNSAPELVGETTVTETNGTASAVFQDDNYIAAIVAYDENNDIIDFVAYGEDEPGKACELTVEYGSAKLVKFVAYDYAGNMSETAVAFIEEPTWITINFAYPDGTVEEYKAYIGEDLYAPVPECEVELGEYSGIWANYDLGDVTEDDLEFYYDYGFIDLIWSDSSVLVTEAMEGATYYPLYIVDVYIEGSIRECEPVYGWYFESEDELDGWTLVDADADGNCWEWKQQSTDNFYAFEGDGVIASASYINGTGALTPDNWAITPAIDLTEMNEASLSLWARGQDESYASENFAIYVGETADPEAMTKVSDDFVSEGNYLNFVVDLTAYAGKTVYVAIRHYDVTDMYWLNIDKVEVFDKIVETDIAPVSDYYYTTQPNGTVLPIEDGHFELVLGKPSATNKTIIVLKDGAKAVSTEANGNNLAAADVTIESNVITSETTGLVFNVEIDDQGNYLFEADGLYLTSAPTGNGLSLSEKNEYSLWQIEAGDVDGDYCIKNVNAKFNDKDQYLEYYNGKFTTYGFNAEKANQYVVNFYTYGVG